MKGAPEPREAARATTAAHETVQPGTRRRFTAAEKLRLVKAAEAAIASGERGALEALLRKEGIYSSLLSTWRRQLAAVDLAPAARCQRRGRPGVANAGAEAQARCS